MLGETQQSNNTIRTLHVGFLMRFALSLAVSRGGKNPMPSWLSSLRNQTRIQKQLRSVRGRDSEFLTAPLGGERRRGEEKRSRNA
jgi:hypothetical protein